jgi:outer membrane protein OmpA-like peptidoglycan-associated protein
MEIFMKTKLFFSLILVLGLSACASHKTKKGTEVTTSTQTAKEAPPAPSMEAKQLASEQETSYVAEFSFRKGSEELSPTSKKQLEEVSKKALTRGKIEMIKVITWADQEYPSAIKNKLSEKQQVLAKKRNETIKNYLKKIHPNTAGEIELISMAQRPSFMKNLLSSDDARIKRSLESAGIPDSESTTKKGGKASKSIVLILVKAEKK